MDFTFDAEQEALRQTARQALASLVDQRSMRDLADAPDAVTPELWASLVSLGWTALLVPEAEGGAGANLLDTCIVLEEMGRVPLPGPFFSSAVLATLSARALGARDLLTGLAEGRRRGTVALHENGYGDPLANVRTRARRKGPGWVVSGRKPLVLDGHSADWALVVARAEDGIRSFALGDVVRYAEAVPTLDPTRKAARLVLDETPVELVGPTGDHGAIWQRVLDDVSVAIAAETVGVIDRALTEAIDYARERVVFDRPVASFQVVRHRIVDMFHKLEMARAGAQFAAWCSDTEAPERERAVAMASGYAAEAGIEVTGDNIQIHGGVGFTWANDAHFLFKRAKQNAVLAGAPGFARQRLARMLVAPY